MARVLYRFGGFAARHGKLIVPIWLVAVVGLVLLANSVGRPTNNDLDLPGTGSTKAADLLARGLPKQQNGSVPIVLRVGSGKLTDSDNAQAINQTVDRLKNDSLVTQVISPLSQKGASSLTNDGRLGFISVFLTRNSGDLSTEDGEQVFNKTEPASAAGIEVNAGGYLGSQLSVPDTASSDRLGVLVAIIVLLFVFGTAVAMAMPIVTALAALLIGLALIGFLGQVIEVPQVAPTLGTMLGLAVGIDYSLFIISRHQRQLRSGMDPHESVARSMATSGSAVVFAGSTVIVALLCLYFGGVELVRALGYSSALVVLIAVAAAMTLLPALLGLLGHRIERLSIPFSDGPPPADDEGTIWARWARWIGKRPAVIAAAGITLLVVLAIPITQIQLGSIDFGQYPEETTERKAYDQLASGFGVGLNAPLLIAVDFPNDKPATNNQQQLEQTQQQASEQQQQTQAEVASGQQAPPSSQQQQQQQNQLNQQEQFLSSPASDPRLVKLQNKIKATDGIKSTTIAQVSNSGDTAAFSAIPATGPSAEQTRNVVSKLRDDVIPEADAEDGLKAFVGGQTASFIDLATEIGDRLVLVIAIVVALGFILIAAAFRSIVIPALAALLNLLAVLAAYGILTAVFELGWGVGLIGLEESLPVVSFVPLLMFAILFGLSMDYQVFLLSRAKEAWDNSHDPRHAVVGGLGIAARVILAAAGIMFAVFASFILNGDPTVKQFGVGLAVAVALDAFVVVAIMPALMLLVGKRTWWIPGWLDRLLPDISIEGEGLFKDDDTEPSGTGGAGGSAEAPVPAGK